MYDTKLADVTSLRNKPRRVRIVHVQLLSILSGVQKVTLDEFSALDPDCYERHLICKSPGPLSEAAAKIGVECHFVDHLQRHVSPKNDYLAYREIRSILKRIGADVVHTHSSKTGLLGRLAGTHQRVPAVVHTVHGFAFPMTRRKLKKRIFEICERVGGKNNDALICLNRDDEALALDKLNVPRSKVFRVANGVGLVDYQTIDSVEILDDLKGEFERSLDLESRPLVVQIGRLWEQKNPQLFVDAACEALSGGVDANFVLIGDGPLRESLQNSIDQRGYGDRIHLAGWRNDVSKILPLADLLILSSSWEGMPLVLLEAGACGVPVIATDIAGSRDCVAEGVTGLLVEPDDSQSLSQAITRLIEDTELRLQMAKESRIHVEKFHDVLDRHRIVQRLYAELLESKGMHDLAMKIQNSLGAEMEMSSSSNLVEVASEH